MMTWKEIAEQQRRNAERRAELEKQVQATPYSKRAEAEIVKAAHNAEVLSVENKILQDNKRHSYVAEKLPGVLEIVNSYAGKSYGPKTKEKMQDEAKRCLNCSFYLEQGNYSADLHIVPLDDRGYSGGSGFRYGELELSTVRDAENKLLPVLDENNKIVARSFEDFRLTGCPEYVEDAHARAELILEAFRAVKEQHRALENACGSLNRLLPSGIDRVLAGYFRQDLKYSA